MRILYITRKFPPSIGGMQTQSSEFYKNLSSMHEVTLISWGYSQLFLPFFMIWAFIASVIKLAREKIDIIQLGDLVLSPLGLLLKLLFNKPVLTISHGRDAAYSNIIYNFFVIGSAKRLDRIICVSNNLKERLLARGFPGNKTVVIPNGIEAGGLEKEQLNKEDAFNIFEKYFKMTLKGKKIILSISRLIPKKGISEFIEEALTRVQENIENVVFLVAGDGPEGSKIDRAVKKLRFSGKVYRLGSIKHDSRLYNALFAVSDVFVMPNKSVKDDAEGFGIVALEAAVNGVPVVAYDVDGITDALHDNLNGVLVKEGEPLLFAEAVSSFLRDSNRRQDFTKKAKEYVAANFNWGKIIGIYLNNYNQLLENQCNKNERNF